MGEYAEHGKLVKSPAIWAVSAALLMWGSAASACRLALVLAMDVSSSVDATEDRLQRAGLASALIDPDVQNAFFLSADPVALHVFEWSGQYMQTTLVPWMQVGGPEDLLVAAAAIGQSTRSQTEFPTAMGSALGHAAIQLLAAPPCAAQTIDLAGDGVNNEGFGPNEAYAAFPFAGVVVNGLVVATDNGADSAEIVRFYRDEVIRGPAAFVEIANGFDDYAATMRRKLIRELSSQMMGAAAARIGAEG